MAAVPSTTTRLNPTSESQRPACTDDQKDSEQRATDKVARRLLQELDKQETANCTQYGLSSEATVEVLMELSALHMNYLILNREVENASFQQGATNQDLSAKKEKARSDLRRAKMDLASRITVMSKVLVDPIKDAVEEIFKKNVELFSDLNNLS